MLETMSEQVRSHRCAECGAVFQDVGDFSEHLKSHEGEGRYEPRLGEESRPSLLAGYAHADREFNKARVPIFGVTLIFLAAFVYATLFHVFLFAPMMIAATLSMILVAGFLMKFVLEG